MRRRILAVIAVLGLVSLAVAGYVALRGETATLPVQAGIGPHPQLPEPVTTLFPTVNIAPAQGWAEGQVPTAAAGLDVRPLAAGLQHPRWLYVLPNGDVLVAEANGPPRPDKGVKAMAMKFVMARAGAGVESPNRITLLRPKAEGGSERFTFLTGLNSPMGMALAGR